MRIRNSMTGISDPAALVESALEYGYDAEPSVAFCFPDGSIVEALASWWVGEGSEALLGGLEVEEFGVGDSPDGSRVLVSANLRRTEPGSTKGMSRAERR